MHYQISSTVDLLEILAIIVQYRFEQAYGESTDAAKITLYALLLPIKHIYLVVGEIHSFDCDRVLNPCMIKHYAEAQNN